MVYHIVCPIQDPQTFDIAKCLGCKYFNMSRGKLINISCRKNRLPIHKRDFEGAYLSYYPGIPDTVAVEGT